MNEQEPRFNSTPENQPVPVVLKRATLPDADAILNIENSLVGIKTYSALTDRQEVIDDIEHNYVYLIEKDGEAVGDISYELKDENHAYISGLAIMPKFQGQGIARQAMIKILTELQGMKTIDLITHPQNTKAIELYASLGFEITGPVMENYFGDGEPRVTMTLQKRQTTDT